MNRIFTSSLFHFDSCFHSQDTKVHYFLTSCDRTNGVFQINFAKCENRLSYYSISHKIVKL